MASLNHLVGCAICSLAIGCAGAEEDQPSFRPIARLDICNPGEVCESSPQDSQTEPGRSQN